MHVNQIAKGMKYYDINKPASMIYFCCTFLLEFWVQQIVNEVTEGGIKSGLFKVQLF